MSDQDLMKLLESDTEEYNDEDLMAMLEDKTGIEIPDDEPPKAPDTLSSEFQIPGGFKPEMQQSMVEQYGFNAEEKAMQDEQQAQQESAFQEQETTRQAELKAAEQERLGNRNMFEKSSDFAAAINSFAFSTLGIPADLANLAEQIGSGGYKKGTAWPTSEVTRQWGADLGVMYADKDVPDTLGTKAGEFTAMGVSMLVPILQAGKVSAAQNLVRPAIESAAPTARTWAYQGQKMRLKTQFEDVSSRIAGEIATPFAKNPVAAWSGEVAANVGAGAGAYELGKEYGPTGEMIGGALGGGLSQAGIMGSSWGANAIKKQILSPFEAGAKPKLRDYLETVRETDSVPADMSRNKIETLPEAKLSSAKQSGDEHLLVLEKEMSMSDPKVYNRIKKMKEETNTLIEEEMQQLGGNVRIEETQAYLKGRVDRLSYVLYERTKMAVKKARAATENLSATDEFENINKVVRKQLNTAKEELKRVETAKWDKVRPEDEVGTAETFLRYRDLIAERAKYVESDEADIPAFVTKLLGKVVKTKDEKTGVVTDKYVRGEYGKTQKLLGLKKFRTKVWNALNESKNSEEKYFLSQLEKAIKKDMQAAKSVEAQEAIAATKLVHDVFEGDVMNTIFKLDRFGKELNENLTLGTITTAGKGGPKAAVDINKILTASPESYDQLENLVKLQLVSSNVLHEIDGFTRVNLKKAEAYYKNNEQVLNIFPKLRDDLNFAIGQEQRFQWTKGNVDTRLKNINKLAASRYSTNKAQTEVVKPGRVLPDILSSQYPEKEMAKVLSQSNKQGRKGIRRAVVEMLMDESGMDADAMISLWKSKKYILAQVFNKNELRRFEMIMKTMDLNKGLRAGHAKLNEILPPKNIILTTVLNLAGLRAGWKVGQITGAQMHAPAKVMGYTRKFTNWLDSGKAKQLLLKSLEDPELFKSLNINPKNLTKQHIKKLMAFQLSTMADSIDDQTQSEEQELQ